MGWGAIHLMCMLTRSRAKLVECVICMEICDDQIGRIQCSHSYCFKCIREWTDINNRCPTCKRKITKIVKLAPVKVTEARLKKKHIQPETISIYSQSQSSSSQPSESSESLSRFSEAEVMSLSLQNHPYAEILYLSYYQQIHLLAQLRLLNGEGQENSEPIPET